MSAQYLRNTQRILVGLAYASQATPSGGAPPAVERLLASYQGRGSQGSRNRCRVSECQAKQLTVTRHPKPDTRLAANFGEQIRVRRRIGRTGVQNHARSIYSRTLKSHHSGSGPALQRPHPGGHPLVNHHAGFLDWLGRHARLDLPHHRCLHSLLIRERSSDSHLNRSVVSSPLSSLHGGTYCCAIGWIAVV